MTSTVSSNLRSYKCVKLWQAGPVPSLGRSLSQTVPGAQPQDSANDAQPGSPFTSPWHWEWCYSAAISGLTARSSFLIIMRPSDLSGGLSFLLGECIAVSTTFDDLCIQRVSCLKQVKWASIWGKILIPLQLTDQRYLTRQGFGPIFAVAWLSRLRTGGWCEKDSSSDLGFTT